MRPQTPGMIAVEQARATSDTVVLSATFVGLFLLSSAYFIIEVLNSEEVGGAGAVETAFAIMGALVSGAFLFGFLLLIGMFLVRMRRQSILGNSLQVEYSDYAWLRDWANHVAADLQMPRVEMFVTQDPVMNAYAFGFARPYCIVLNSGSIRYLSRDELMAVIVHEMAHIKYGHTAASVYLQPFLAIPVVGVVTAWIAGFWQRRAEYTSDRLALTYLADPELVKSALIKIHVGPDVAAAMNQVAQQWLRYTAERPMNRFAQTFSSHPFLVRRLMRIDQLGARYYRPVDLPAAAPHAEQ